MSYKKIKTPDSGKKIKVIGAEMKKIDMAKIAEGLGAESYSPLRELTKEEAEQCQPIGGPYLMAVADEIMILRNASSMLSKLGKHLDDVVGYRVLSADEEQEFRQQCAEKDSRYLHLLMVRYYSKKSEQK